MTETIETVAAPAADPFVRQTFLVAGRTLLKGGKVGIILRDADGRDRYFDQTKDLRSYRADQRISVEANGTYVRLGTIKYEGLLPDADARRVLELAERGFQADQAMAAKRKNAPTLSTELLAALLPYRKAYQTTGWGNRDVLTRLVVDALHTRPTKAELGEGGDADA